MEFNIVTCINCKNKLKVRKDVVKYKCVYCGTEYEYAEIINDNLLEVKGENVD